MRMLRFLLALAGTKRGAGLSDVFLQTLLARVFRRTPMGFLAMFLVEKALRDDGRLWGMDLASRRKARMAWLVRAIQFRT